MTVIMATRQAEIMDWQRALSSDNLACTDLRLHGAVKGRTSHHERGPLNWCFPPRVLHAFDLTLRPMSGRSNRTLPQAASLRTDPHVCGSNSPAPDANSTTSGPSGFLPWLRSTCVGNGVFDSPARASAAEEGPQRCCVSVRAKA